jgi:plastocyanin
MDIAATELTTMVDDLEDIMLNLAHHIVGVSPDLVSAVFAPDAVPIKMHTPTLTTFSAVAALAAGAKIQIAVGKDGLVFTPNSVTAAMGDVIEYQFFPPIHSVIMGDFNNPCMPAATGGFFSGGFTTSSGQNVSVPHAPPGTAKRS